MDCSRGGLHCFWRVHQHDVSAPVAACSGGWQSAPEQSGLGKETLGINRVLVMVSEWMNGVKCSSASLLASPVSMRRVTGVLDWAGLPCSKSSFTMIQYIIAKAILAMSRLSKADQQCTRARCPNRSRSQTTAIVAQNARKHDPLIITKFLQLAHTLNPLTLPDPHVPHRSTRCWDHCESCLSTGMTIKCWASRKFEPHWPNASRATSPKTTRPKTCTIVATAPAED